MLKKFETETEGVLILVSKKGLYQYYQDKEFEYRYPEGLLPAINAGVILPITTESTDTIEVILRSEEDFDSIEGTEFGQCKLFLEEEDSLQLLNHADFTMICDYHKGNIDAYNFYEEQQVVDSLKQGWYLVTLLGKLLEEEKVEITFDLIWLAEEPHFIQHTDVYVV